MGQSGDGKQNILWGRPYLHLPVITFLETGYNVTYSNDKRYGAKGYHVTSSVEKIATEIMTNGPVEGAFTVYADFPSYKSGKKAFRQITTRTLIFLSYQNDSTYR